MITTLFDVEASLEASQRQIAQGAMKTWEDLARYDRILTATAPELIVECGTFAGGLARWFAGHGLEVVTIDVVPRHVDDARVMFLLGDSTAGWVVDTVTKLAAGKRTMVVLDSDHSGPHVAREIAAYGPLVTPGCYIVVEDGIVRWMAGLPYDGLPLDAIEVMLEPSPFWWRDEDVETIFPVTMFPAGWWRREVT